jgi:hypothetical protein
MLIQVRKEYGAASANKPASVKYRSKQISIEALSVVNTVPQVEFQLRGGEL